MLKLIVGGVCKSSGSLGWQSVIFPKIKKIEIEGEGEGGDGQSLNDAAAVAMTTTLYTTPLHVELPHMAFTFSSFVSSSSFDAPLSLTELHQTPH